MGRSGGPLPHAATASGGESLPPGNTRFLAFRLRRGFGGRGATADKSARNDARAGRHGRVTRRG